MYKQQSNVIEAVYYVQCDHGSLQLDPIAIRPVIQSDLVKWGDTGRGTILKIKRAEMKAEAEGLPERIEIELDQGQHVTLLKMTLRLFNKNVKDRAAGKPIFSSDKEVQDYYLNTNFTYYGD